MIPIEFLIKLKDVDPEEFDDLEFMKELEQTLNAELTKNEAKIENIEPAKSAAAGRPSGSCGSVSVTFPPLLRNYLSLRLIPRYEKGIPSLPELSIT